MIDSEDCSELKSLMAYMSGKIDVEKLILYGNDLVDVLKNEREINFLKHCVEKSDSLQSHCHSDYINVRNSLEDYQKKIDVCKQKTYAAKAEVAADAEIDLLQRELDEELQRESLLKEELRVINNQMDDLERQRGLIEERKQVLKKLEQDETKAQMRLSMYASVTNIIPNLNHQSKTSGHIVDKEKKVVEMFEFSSQEMTDFDTCCSIWKMISQ